MVLLYEVDDKKEKWILRSEGIDEMRRMWRAWVMWANVEHCEESHAL